MAVLVFDDDRRYLYANEAACALLGRSRDEVLSSRIDDMVEPGSPLDEYWARFRRDGVMIDSYPVIGPDGFRDVPFIAVANVAPGRHMAVLVEDPAHDARRLPLSRREREVVALVAAGATGREIGEALEVSAATVESHIRNAMERLGARNRAHLVTLSIARREIDLSRLAD